MKSKQINEFASAIQSRIRFATFRELGRAPKIIRQGAKKKESQSPNYLNTNLIAQTRR